MVDELRTRRHQLAVEIAQAREQAEPVDPWTDTQQQRLVLLEAAVKVIYNDLTRLLAALEELE